MKIYYITIISVKHYGSSIGSVGTVGGLGLGEGVFTVVVFTDGSDGGFKSIF